MNVIHVVGGWLLGRNAVCGGVSITGWVCWVPPPPPAAPEADLSDSSSRGGGAGVPGPYTRRGAFALSLTLHL